MESLVLNKNNIKTFQGNSREDISYIDGLRTGPYTLRDLNGTVEEEGFYVKDELDGIYRKYKDGVLSEEINYKHGVLHGDHIFYEIRRSCGDDKDYFIKERITYVNGKIKNNNCIIL